MPAYSDFFWSGFCFGPGRSTLYFCSHTDLKIKVRTTIWYLTAFAVCSPGFTVRKCTPTIILPRVARLRFFKALWIRQHEIKILICKLFLGRGGGAESVGMCLLSIVS